MDIFFMEPVACISKIIPRATVYPSISYGTVQKHPLLNGTNTHIQKLYFQTFPPVYGTKYYVTYSYSHPVQGVVVQYPTFYAPKVKSYVNHMQSYVKAHIWDG
ncbi:hypothetical protein BACCIP111899_03581 [Bacillus rhizoplanae]|uniref:Uncharacterized protein n=1 Tax=Bacillus rhizoplanae TaxID=2880966 RepID=A0ABN7ZZQ4_9BACI|nr:hypothetical protein [Bacillus rhizoplanae]CAG9614354.1 hypothetical protein BACCIP111899_03581 [Bacillus rhizoplanae]